MKKSPKDSYKKICEDLAAMSADPKLIAVLVLRKRAKALVNKEK